MLHHIHRIAREAQQLAGKLTNAAAAAAAADYEKIMLHRIYRVAREAQQLAGNFEAARLHDVDWFKDTTAALRSHLQVLSVIVFSVMVCL
jgi:hypothetical protein